MNELNTTISPPSQLCCSFTQHDGCVFENVTVTEEGKIRSVTINLTGNNKNWQKCDCFRNKETFDRMLDFIGCGGSVNILIDGKLPRNIIEYFKRNDSFRYKEYRANKDFTALFSIDNPYTILYYYSCVNSKTKFITVILWMLIKIKQYRLMWRIYAENCTIVLTRIL